MKQFRTNSLMAACLALASAGCNMSVSHMEAREQAQQRWNKARADVKAQLAADQLAAGNVAEAGTEINKALALQPDNPKLKVLRARTALAAGDAARAQTLLEGVTLEGVEQAEVAYMLGVIQQQHLKWDEAFTKFAQAAELNPDESAYYVAVVQAMLQMGQPREAIEYLKANEDRFGWTPAYHAALAECHEQLAQWDDAAAAWQMVLDAHEDDGVSERLSTALFRAGRFEQALPFLRAAVENKEQPAGESTRRMFAECLLEVGEFEAARQALMDLLAESPRDTASLMLLSRSYIELNRIDLALRTARRAIDASPQDFEPLELAAAISFRLGRIPQAAAFARKAQTLSPENDSPVVRQILQVANNRSGSPKTARLADN